MPWDSNDYKAALLLGALVVVALIAGLYIVTQWRASQPPMEFKGEQTSSVFYAGDARAQNVQWAFQQFFSWPCEN